MFRKIMVPVDLEHRGELAKAIEVAHDLAGRHGAEIVYCGVTTNAPSSVAHTPEEYRGKLEEFAAGESKSGGHRASAHAIVSNDPAVDLDNALEDAAAEIGADLIVMATHAPGKGSHVWSSHGGEVAGKTDASVFLVRS